MYLAKPEFPTHYLRADSATEVVERRGTVGSCRLVPGDAHPQRAHVARRSICAASCNSRHGAQMYIAYP